MTPLKEASRQIVQICIHLKHSFKLLVYPIKKLKTVGISSSFDSVILIFIKWIKKNY